MMQRRDFLRLSSLFVPVAIADPRRVYSFIWAPKPYVWEPVLDARVRAQVLDSEDLWLDADGNVQFVKTNVGELIAKSLERSIRDWQATRHWKRIIIQGTIKF